jgi:hypothetical protein
MGNRMVRIYIEAIKNKLQIVERIIIRIFKSIMVRWRRREASMLQARNACNISVTNPNPERNVPLRRPRH